MIKIGLTGGAGSGKTTVANMFADLGIDVVDADLISKQLTTTEGLAYAQIIQYFGPDIKLTDGNIDRAQLRQIIFNDPSAKSWLEELLHPLIRSQILQQMNAATSAYVIAVIPLLFEGHFDYGLDRVCVVDTTVALQIERICQRDHCPSQLAQTIIDQQASRQDKLAQADDVIENDGDLVTLKQQVFKLNAYYLNLAQAESTDED